MIRFSLACFFALFGYAAHAKCTGDCQDGYGRFVFSNGEVYVGEHRNGRESGKGRFEFKSGAVYEGDWKNGYRHGDGQMVYSNGDVLRGQWAKGEKHGFGTYTFKSGGVFIGEYREGDLYFGESRYSNGKVYKGSFKNNMYHGLGLLTFKDGSTHYGFFAEDKPVGRGIFTDATGKKTSGVWRGGKLVKSETVEFTFTDQLSFVSYNSACRKPGSSPSAFAKGFCQPIDLGSRLKKRANKPKPKLTMGPFWENQREQARSIYYKACEGDKSAIQATKAKIKEGHPVFLGASGWLRANCKSFKYLPLVEVAQYQKQSAELGYPIGISTYGFRLIYNLNDGVERDWRRGLEMVNSAIEKGYVTPAVSLAQYYLEGKYLPKDLSKAKDYVRIAEDAGLSSSRLDKVKAGIAQAER